MRAVGYMLQALLSYDACIESRAYHVQDDPSHDHDERHKEHCRLKIDVSRIVAGNLSPVVKSTDLKHGEQRCRIGAEIYSVLWPEQVHSNDGVDG